MASSLFKDYSFRAGKLTVTRGERLNAVLPLYARKTDIVLLISQCSINGANGNKSVIVPANNVIQISAEKRKAFKFFFPESEICNYNVGATLIVEIWEQIEQVHLMVCYTYKDTKSGWMTSSVSLVDDASDMSDEEDILDVLFADEDLDSNDNIIVDLTDLDFPLRIYNTLKRAGFDTLNDITKLTIDELSKVRGMRPDSLMQVLTALREHNMWLVKEHIDADAGNTIRDKKADEAKASADIKIEKITSTSEYKIKPGYRIIHEKFGEGLVTSVGDHVEVKFSSIPKIQLKTAWVEANCRIIT